MKTKIYFILFALLNVLFMSSCVTRKNVSQKVSNFYTSAEIEQYIQKRFLHASDSLKIGSLFIIDGIPFQKRADSTFNSVDLALKKYDTSVFRSIYFLDAKKHRIGCGPIDYDVLPIIITNAIKQKRTFKKKVLIRVKERYFSGQFTVNTRPLIIFNRKPLTVKTAFKILQTLKVGHIEYIQKYEESQVIAGFEHISKNGVVEIFTK